MAALSMRKTVLASCVSALMLFGAGMSTPASADINKQAEILSNTFNEWKADFEQLDDVCVIGVKL
jgi:hypothetical protein